MQESTNRDGVTPLDAHLFRGNPAVERLLFEGDVPLNISATLTHLSNGAPLDASLQPAVVYVVDGVELSYPNTGGLPEVCYRKINWAGGVQVYGRVLTNREAVALDEPEPLYLTTPSGQQIEASVTGDFSEETPDFATQFELFLQS